MKKLIVILMILIFANLANASPFLVCDPNADATFYEITGSIETLNWSAEADGSIKYDLQGITEADYNIEVKACNFWGCSTPVPFPFTKKLPQLPTGLKLAK